MKRIKEIRDTLGNEAIALAHQRIAELEAINKELLEACELAYQALHAELTTPYALTREGMWKKDQAIRLMKDARTKARVAIARAKGEEVR